MKDEDYDYGQWKQRQIDDGTWRGNIGAGLKQADKVQKFERTDPNPHIPFAADPSPPKDGLGALWAMCGGLLVLFIVTRIMEILK